MPNNRTREIVKAFRNQTKQDPPVEWLMKHAGIERAEAVEAIAEPEGIETTRPPVAAVPSAVYRPVVNPQPKVPKVKKIETESQTDTPHHKKKKRRPALEVLEQFMVSFGTGLQYIAFIFGSIVDLGSACFFYWTLAPDPVSKAIFATWGLVQTGGKLFGWTYSRVRGAAMVMAIVAATMGAFGTSSIAQAAFELQAEVVTAENARTTAVEDVKDPSVSLSAEIETKKAEIKKATDLRDANIPAPHADGTPILPGEWKTYNRFETDRADRDGELQKLKAQQSDLTAKKEAPLATQTVPEAKPVTLAALHLDAWRIFRQWTSLDFSKKENAPRILSFIFCNLFALLLELIVWATTPRKTKLLAK